MGGVGRSVHTFRRELFVKFRKSPHRTEKSLRHAQKPANPRSTNPIGPESTSVTPGKDPPMATPPRARKMTPERPCPVLIETGKSHPKTGLFPAVFQRFSRQVRRRFSGGSTAFLPVVSGSFPAVLPPVFQRFDAGFPAVRRQFSSGFPAVFRRFDAGFPAVFRQLPGSFPAVCRWFDRGFAGGSTAVSWWFPGGLAGGFTDGSTATRSPWINPGPAPAYPFIRKKLSGNSVHTFKPTNPAYGKRKVSAGTWSPGKKRCRQEPNAPGGSSGGPDSRAGCLGGHIPRNVSNRPFWTERCGLCVA